MKSQGKFKVATLAQRPSLILINLPPTPSSISCASCPPSRTSMHCSKMTRELNLVLGLNAFWAGLRAAHST